MASLPALRSLAPLPCEGTAAAVPAAAPKLPRALRWGIAAHLITDNFAQVAGAGLGLYLVKPLPASPRWQWQAGAAYQVRHWQTRRSQVVPLQLESMVTGGAITVTQTSSRHELLLPVSLSYQVAPRWRLSSGLSLGYLLALREAFPVGNSLRSDFSSSPVVDATATFSNLYDSQESRSVLAYRSKALSGADVRVNRLQVMPTVGVSFSLSQRVALHGRWQYEAVPTLVGGGYEVQRHYTTLGISRTF